MAETTELQAPSVTGELLVLWTERFENTRFHCRVQSPASNGWASRRGEPHHPMQPLDGRSRQGVPLDLVRGRTRGLSVRCCASSPPPGVAPSSSEFYGSGGGPAALVRWWAERGRLVRFLWRQWVAVWLATRHFRETRKLWASPLGSRVLAVDEQRVIVRVCHGWTKPPQRAWFAVYDRDGEVVELSGDEAMRHDEQVWI